MNLDIDLYDYLEKANKPFEWGEHDCCTFAANWAKPDALKKYNYSTKIGAGRMLKKHGGVEGIASTWLQEKPVAFAQRGDIVSIEIHGNIVLGICAGIKSWFLSENGLVALKTEECKKAWQT